YDMAGNVWEWTSSLRKSYPYKAEDGREDPKAGGRVFRGRSWNDPVGSGRASDRNATDPRINYFKVGFRCAKTR
ncbi:MAG: SUMF1/EgtB/PvdO family nonheme iron enzyme, partial [candidate division NC10 bacterium]|nr:SUMF1/EgtB/PvdO family nonheme iron enzyme [candidate division NC10 bacterium]